MSKNVGYHACWTYKVVNWDYENGLFARNKLNLRNEFFVKVLVKRRATCNNLNSFVNRWNRCVFIDAQRNLKVFIVEGDKSQDHSSIQRVYRAAVVLPRENSPIHLFLVLKTGVRSVYVVPFCIYVVLINWYVSGNRNTPCTLLCDSVYSWTTNRSAPWSFLVFVTS